MELSYAAIWAGLAVGLAGVWVGLGQSMVAKSALEILGMNPRIASMVRNYTLLGIVLVETAMIYAIIIAFGILGNESLSPTEAIGAGLVMGLTAFWAGFWEGKVVSASLEAVNRNPDNVSQVRQFMILFLVLVETVAVYGLIVAFEILSK